MKKKDDEQVRIRLLCLWYDCMGIYSFGVTCGKQNEKRICIRVTGKSYEKNVEKAAKITLKLQKHRGKKEDKTRYDSKHIKNR